MVRQLNPALFCSVCFRLLSAMRVFLKRDAFISVNYSFQADTSPRRELRPKTSVPRVCLLFSCNMSCFPQFKGDDEEEA
jgi:hypothetical protein